MSKTLNDLIIAGVRAGKNDKEVSYEDKIKVLRAFLSPLQRSFIDDEHRFKVARCGRRGGKSVMDVIYLIITCLENPNTPTLYLGLTRESAKNTIWDFVCYTCERLGINIEARVSELRINFDNGSFIRLFGADTSNGRERLRGQKFKLIIVDEMGFYSGADYLIEAVIPMLADYQGTICMTSSPGLVLAGMFYEADQGSKSGGWSQYHWDMRSNPHFMTPVNKMTKPIEPYMHTFKDGYTLEVKTAAELEMVTIVKNLYGDIWSHPGFQREYLGLWVADNTTLVYPYATYNDKPGHNVVKEDFSLEEPLYAIGIDLGSISDNSIVVLQYSHHRREAVFVEAWKGNDMRVDALGAKISEYYEKYAPTHIVADTGGYGRGIVDELKYRYTLPIQAAEKTDKAFYQSVFSNDLLSGWIKARSEGALLLLAEWANIIKDEKGSEVVGQVNHAADAALYVYRKVYQIHLKLFEPPKTEEDRMLDHVLNQVRQNRIKDSEDGEYGIDGSWD